MTACLCIGGPKDGETITILHGNEMIIYDTDHVVSVDNHAELGCIRYAPLRHVYKYVGLQGSAQMRFNLLVHSDRTIDDAIAMLLESYAKKSKQEPSSQYR
jgi:hypothetical protein